MIQITCVLLIFIALAHFYWSLGGKYGLDKAMPTNVNKEKLLEAPKLLTALVGFILLWFSYIAYMLWVGEQTKTIVYIGWIIGTIFLLRAIGEFRIVGIFKKVKGTTFAKYDTFVYIPWHPSNPTRQLQKKKRKMLN